jgi:hypothetical protein
MNHSHGHEPPKEGPRHNMLVVGDKAIFLSHLPMFMAPHNLQFILEATLASKENGADKTYFADRQSHPDTRVYTLEPEVLDLDRLLAPDSGNSQPRSFKGTVFRGHLERGGLRIKDLTDIQVNVENIIYSQRFDPGLDKSEHLEYILFGKGQDLFLAHVIAAPPDFDQILSVQIDTPPTQDEITRGVRVSFLERRNISPQRVKEGDTIQGRGHVTGAHQFLNLQFQAGVEFYFEEGELSSQM